MTFYETVEREAAEHGMVAGGLSAVVHRDGQTREITFSPLELRMNSTPEAFGSLIRARMMKAELEMKSHA